MKRVAWFLIGVALSQTMILLLFRHDPSDAELRERAASLRAEADRIDAELAKKGAVK